MSRYPEIDRLEEPLRKAHAELVTGVEFQTFVNAVRRDPAHPLHSTAVAYNEAVYRIQN